MKVGIVISYLPDAGLGNKLFVWAHGVLFAYNNNLQHYIIGLTKLKIGPILRGETTWRFYRNYFKRELLLSRLQWSVLKIQKKKLQFFEYNNCINIINNVQNKVFVFNQIPHWSDYFQYIRENRSTILPLFWKALDEEVIAQFNKKNIPDIGIHIRMGDFSVLKQNESLLTVGNARTPLKYFISIIKQLRLATSKKLEVTIFSDGNVNQLQEILEVEGVSLAPDDNDLQQMLHLSKSKIIVLSGGSTYGQWAAYLSQAIVINHYQQFHSYIRPKEVNEFYYEGVQNPEESINSKLMASLQKL